MTRDELIRYAAERFSTDPEYPWDDENFILRHSGNRKWFALLMDVPREKLGLSGAEHVDVINLKCDAMSGALRQQPGILPAYHMHRDSWVTVLLDGTVPIEDILPLIDLSYQLTSAKPKRSKKIKD